ncbi:hypothetical protein ILUMI_24366 [Ignelater luminosus]|uniref:Reverse transcriptase RNase H-like domain-containing protein n=1 Tax=Ignelater luminosus TaxID=2038154 RepID=A0A8K0C6D8_IGNLU|nr:hypothetical protein ILUMI_24366 [Ignelater luminosus]
MLILVLETCEFWGLGLICPVRNEDALNCVRQERECSHPTTRKSSNGHPRGVSGNFRKRRGPSNCSDQDKESPRMRWCSRGHPEDYCSYSGRIPVSDLQRLPPAGLLLERLEKGNSSHHTQFPGERPNSSLSPITLLPELGKVFERVIKELIIRETGENELHHPNQHGFCKEKSTVHAINRLIQTVRGSENKYVALLSADISGAFYDIRHSIIGNKKSYNCRPTRGLLLLVLKMTKPKQRNEEAHDTIAVQPPVMLSQEQFQEMISAIQPRPIPNTRSSQGASIHQVGSFVNCHQTFNETLELDVEAFIKAVTFYKDSATWWNGIKDQVISFDNAIDRLRSTFGVKIPPYRIYREIFDHQQDDLTPTDIFICRIRSLFAQLSSTLPEDVQLDMTYGLLSLRIRKRLCRDSIKTSDELSNRARPNNNVPTDVVRIKAKVERVEKSDTPKKAMFSCYRFGPPGVIKSACFKCKSSSTNNKETSVSTIDIFSFYLKQFGEPPRPKEGPILLIDVNGCVGCGLIDMGARQSVTGEGYEEKPVEYTSRLMTPTERKYDTTQREALVIVWACHKFCGYIEDNEVEIAFDHQPLRWLLSLKSSKKIGQMGTRSPILSLQLPHHGSKLEDPDVRKIFECFKGPSRTPDLANWLDRRYLMNNGILYRS